MSEFTPAMPAPLRDDGPDIGAVPWQVCEWKAETPELTVQTAVACDVRHGIAAAMSRAYERALRKPHRIIRTRPMEELPRFVGRPGIDTEHGYTNLP